jgi:hypothetical protein
MGRFLRPEGGSLSRVRVGPCHVPKLGTGLFNVLKIDWLPTVAGPIFWSLAARLSDQSSDGEGFWVAARKELSLALFTLPHIELHHSKLSFTISRVDTCIASLHNRVGGLCTNPHVARLWQNTRYYGD